MKEEILSIASDLREGSLKLKWAAVIALTGIALLFFLSGCESQRAANKTAWLKKKGYYTPNDSAKFSLPADSSNGSAENLPDSFISIVERILTGYKDTCISKQKVREVANKAANKLNYPKQIDSNTRHYAEIWIQDGKPMWRIIDKPVGGKVPCPDCIKETTNVVPWWYWLILSGMGVVIFGLTFRK